MINTTYKEMMMSVFAGKIKSWAALLLAGGAAACLLALAGCGTASEAGTTSTQPKTTSVAKAAAPATVTAAQQTPTATTAQAPAPAGQQPVVSSKSAQVSKPQSGGCNSACQYQKAKAAAQVKLQQQMQAQYAKDTAYAKKMESELNCGPNCSH